MMKAFLVQQIFDETAKRFWDKPALYYEENSLSYGELYRFSNQLAHCLRRNGVKRGDRISLILRKSINSIKALLGTLKADAVYVPVDWKSPMERAKEIIDDCKPAAIICDCSSLKMVKALLNVISHEPRVIVLDLKEDGERAEGLIWQDEIMNQKEEEPVYFNIDTDLAYIIYTSGSTGKPKGVLISHLNIFNYVNWAVDYFSITSEDNILNTSPLHFDMSVFDVYCTLGTGASLTLVADQLLLFPGRLVEIIEKQNISLWKGVSSLLSYMAKLQALNPERMKSLRKIIFSGETLPAKYLAEWMRAYPSKEFYNAYGPTECTGISTCYKVTNIPIDLGEPIPIGKACANTEVFAISENGRLAEIGEIAELCIRGSSLSAGYWNDPDRTNKAFVQNPFNNRSQERVYRTGDLVRQLPDGNYVFIGRKDAQIKYMGYRIELGEIECVLQGLDGVKDAIVLALKDEAVENPVIVAFLETDSKTEIEQIREALSARIPKYMIPMKFHVLKSLPRTENGKVDRQLLLRLSSDLQ